MSVMTYERRAVRELLGAAQLTVLNGDYESRFCHRHFKV